MKENVVEYKNCKNGFFAYNKKKLFELEVGRGRDRITLPKYIVKLLENVYTPKGKWVLQINKGGVFDTGYEFDNEGRSLLNYLNTNYTAICILVNWINKEIVAGRIRGFTQLDFYLSSWPHELEKLMKILNKHKDMIFDKYSDVLPDMLKAMDKTSKIGDAAEKETVKRLMDKGISDITQSKFGETKDMWKGVDIVFSYGTHKNQTIQTKSFTRMDETDTHYIFYINGIKPYKVDYFSFYNDKTKRFYMFTNSDTIEFLNKNNEIKIPKVLKRDI